MKRLAVLGHPVAHSRSPEIHRLFADATGIALDYQAIDIAPDALADHLSRSFSDAWTGFNVTLPHKVAVAEHCVERSLRAEQAGAVNTLLRGPNGWIGDNTDGEGLMADLRRLGVSLVDRRVLIIGAGGAARGILGPLLACRPAALVLSNRNPWKPEALAEAFAPVGRVTPRTHLALKGDQFDVVINATSAGHAGEMPRLPPGLLAASGVAYDLSYGAAHKPFAAWARAAGATSIHDGFGMLVEQAAASFACWHGVQPPTATAHALNH